MAFRAIDEYNDGGHLIFAADYPGAFVRGRTREEALQKFPVEMAQYCRWLNIPVPKIPQSISIIQEKRSPLNVHDADSDILFDSETLPLTDTEYLDLKRIALQSAADFEQLYRSIPNKTDTVLSPRETFYGPVPITAEEMYRHTKNVNHYYFGEIHVEADNEPDIYTCRLRGFERLEARAGYLENERFAGSFDEEWTLRKLFRRFIWHDRIHAKAMYRMAVQLCKGHSIANPFLFTPREMRVSKPK